VETGEPFTKTVGLEDVRRVTYSPDGTRLAISTFEGLLKIYRQTNHGLAEIRSQPEANPISDLRFSPDGLQLAVCVLDHGIQLIDSDSGRTERVFRGHNGGAMSICFSADGRFLASAGIDGRVKLWDLTRPDQPQTISAGGSFIADLESLPDGERVVLAGAFNSALGSNRRERVARLVNLATGETNRIFSGHEGWLTGVAIDSTGSRIATSSEDGTVRLWDITSGEQQSVLRGHRGSVLSVAFAGDDQAVVSIGDDATVRSWRSNDGEPLRTWSVSNSSLVALATSERGSDILVAERNGSVHQFRLEDDGEVGSFQLPGPLRSLAFSPNGSRLALASAATIGLAEYDSQTASVAGLQWNWLVGHTEAVISVRFDRTGERLVSTSLDRSTKLWDASSGQEVLSLSGLGVEGTATTLFSGDNRRVVHANRNQLSVWTSHPAGTDPPEPHARQPIIDWHQQRASHAKDRSAWFAAKFHWEQLLHIDAGNPSYVDERGLAAFQLRDWNAAIADLQQTRTRDRSRMADYRLALSYLASGNVADYRQLCTELMRDNSESSDAEMLNRIAWTCLLHPEAGVDYERLVGMMQIVAAQNSSTGSLNTLGLAQLRAGQFDKAIVTLNQCLDQQNPGTMPYDWLFLAMAHRAAGDTDKSAEFLGRIQSWYDERLAEWNAGQLADPVFDNNGQLELELLLREARQ
jgi:WD40 repeat protein/tetratricopeptide (TPR) repeat protein